MINFKLSWNTCVLFNVPRNWKTSVDKFWKSICVSVFILHSEICLCLKNVSFSFSFNNSGMKSILFFLKKIFNYNYIRFVQKIYLILSGVNDLSFIYAIKWSIFYFSSLCLSLLFVTAEQNSPFNKKFNWVVLYA